MSGKIARKLVAAAVLLAVSLTTGDVARQATKGEDVAAAAPISATDETKVPHYFGPYPNWANSPQVLADAIVDDRPGDADAGRGRQPADRSVRMRPTTRLRRESSVRCSWSYRTQAARRQSAEFPDLEPGGRRQAVRPPSAGGLFHAYVLRPTGTPSQYTVVYDSGRAHRSPLADPSVSEVATFPVAPAVAVQAGDVIGFYGQGIPVDTGVTVNPDILELPGER